MVRKQGFKELQLQKKLEDLAMGKLWNIEKHLVEELWKFTSQPGIL
jgi:hypothetical protein